MTVADASILITALADPGEDDLLQRRLSAPRVLHAPHLIDAEAANAIRGLLLGSKLSLSRAAEMLRDFGAIRIVRHPMQPTLSAQSNSVTTSLFMTLCTLHSPKRCGCRC